MSRKRVGLGFLLLTVVASLLNFSQSRSALAAKDARVRIGVYDSRAVAVAYAASRYNPVREKMAEQQAAKAAGDAQKVRELEAWGQQHQRMLHFQGFCRVPVTDRLEPVKGGLDQIVADQKLAAIAMSCDAIAGDVETVDVTDAIIELYEPSDKVRQNAADIRKVKPVSLLEIGKSDTHRK